MISIRSWDENVTDDIDMVLKAAKTSPIWEQEDEHQLLSLDPHFESASCSSSPDVLVQKAPPPMEKKKLKNIRKSDIYVCEICGDKPTGYHYDVVSCNGCKTFFRRTVIANRKFVCTRGGNCTFNKDFRCACRACRFNKCVEKGMNPAGIQYPSMSIKREPSEEDFEEKPKKESLCMAVVPINQPKSPENEVTFLINELIRRENTAHELRERSSLFVTCKLTDILKEPILLGSQSGTGKLQKLEQQGSELVDSNPIKYWMVSDLHLMVEYAKTFPAFRALQLDDQRVLLSHIGGLLLLIAQAFYSVEKNSNAIVFPDGSAPLDAIRVRKCATALLDDRSEWIYELFAYSVHIMRQNKFTNEIYALIRAIVLFSPLDSDLSEEARHMVSNERDKLVGALNRLIFSEYGSNAPNMLQTVHSTIQSLLLISEKRRQRFEVFDLVGSMELSALAKEIYLRRRNL